MNEIQNLPWARVRSWAENELNVARNRLEKLDTTADETQQLRGAIRALKKLTELPQELAPQQTQTTPLGWPGGDGS